jgi:glycosyltransferase involved in cell wall biosynthesis
MIMSVAMCTYDGEKYLAEQLESIANQTRKPDELVVCDDSSTDESLSILKKFALRASFPVHIHQNEKRLGSMANFEQAISLTKGDIIALSDQDDVWHKEKLQKFENVFIAKPNVGLVFCNGELVDEDLRSMNRFFWDVIEFTPVRQELLKMNKPFPLLYQYTFVAGCMMAFRSAYKKLILPFPSNYKYRIHDGWIALLIAATTGLEPIDEPLIKYRQHSNQQLGVVFADENHALTIKALRGTEWKDYLAEELKFYRPILKRLEDRADEFSFPRALSQLRARIKHLQARAEMIDAPLKRLPLIIRELFTGRYHAYSRGLRSVVKDLILH